MISVVIRTYNEKDNLKKLLHILANQSIENEVIIVDSNSNDGTQELCDDFDTKLVQCNPFTYGKGLNVGIEKSKYKYICSLSAHCFPTNDNFLLTMYNNFDDRVAGVYSKQEATDGSNILDKRNLMIIFRTEKLQQINDYFFNNASSMFRKDIWEKFNFREDIAAWEDLLWAHSVQKVGYKIIYEPKAIVKHYHIEGIDKTISRYEKEYNTICKLKF